MLFSALRMDAHGGTSPDRYGTLAPLTLTALGVVYGDIGTSPLYAIRECFFGSHSVPPTHDNVLGVLSLVLYALVLAISVKYTTLVMRADNQGEGGIRRSLPFYHREWEPLRSPPMTAVSQTPPTRVSGTAVFMTAQPRGTPPALAHNLRYNKILHEHVIVLTVTTSHTPYVPPISRFRFSRSAWASTTCACSMDSCRILMSQALCWRRASWESNSMMRT